MDGVHQGTWGQQQSQLQTRILDRSMGQGLQWTAKSFLWCTAGTFHSHFRSDLWPICTGDAKRDEPFGGRISSWTIFNLVIGQVRGLFCVAAGILEDAHVLTPPNPYCICIKSKLGLLQLTNSVCPSSSNLGLFLRNTLSLIIHPVLIVHHVCRGCWWGSGCCTMHKGEGHSLHQHYRSSEQAQKHNHTPSVFISLQLSGRIPQFFSESGLNSSIQNPLEVRFRLNWDI